MNNSNNIKYWIWSLIVLVVLVVTAWVYFDKINEQERFARSDRSIETGVSFFNEKKYSEAIEIFERVPSGTPRKWYALYYQGSTYIVLKDFQAAATYLEQALNLNPTNTKIMHALGVAYFKQGNLKLSKAYYASVLEIDPNNEEAKGLMEIMANLEKQQSESIPADSEIKSEEETPQQ